MAQAQENIASRAYSWMFKCSTNLWTPELRFQWTQLVNESISIKDKVIIYAARWIESKSPSEWKGVVFFSKQHRKQSARNFMPECTSLIETNYDARTRKDLAQMIKMVQENSPLDFFEYGSLEHKDDDRPTLPLLLSTSLSEKLDDISREFRCGEYKRSGYMCKPPSPSLKEMRKRQSELIQMGMSFNHQKLSRFKAIRKQREVRMESAFITARLASQEIDRANRLKLKSKQMLEEYQIWRGWIINDEAREKYEPIVDIGVLDDDSEWLDAVKSLKYQDSNEGEFFSSSPSAISKIFAKQQHEDYIDRPLPSFCTQRIRRYYRDGHIINITFILKYTQPNLTKEEAADELAKKMNYCKVLIRSGGDPVFVPSRKTCNEAYDRRQKGLPPQLGDEFAIAL